jgi:hypothetical protein
LAASSFSRNNETASRDSFGMSRRNEFARRSCERSTIPLMFNNFFGAGGLGFEPPCGILAHGLYFRIAAGPIACYGRSCAGGGALSILQGE